MAQEGSITENQSPTSRSNRNFEVVEDGHKVYLARLGRNSRYLVVGEFSTDETRLVLQIRDLLNSVGV